MTRIVSLLVIFLALIFMFTKNMNCDVILDEADHEFDLTSSESENELDPGRTLEMTPPESSDLPWYISVPVRSHHEKMFQDVFNILLKKGLFFNSPKQKAQSPYLFKKPAKLSQKLDFQLGEHQANHSTLLKYLERILHCSPHPSHPYYLVKTGTGLDPHALAGEWVSTTINSVPLLYSLSPVATMMEIVLTKKLRDLIGYPNGDGDGVPTPGSTFSNTMAVNMALQKKFPTFKEKGFVGGGVPEFAIFLSVSASSSFKKAQIFNGFPKKAIVEILTDEDDRMDIDELRLAVEKAVADGVTPLMVIGTVGTRDLGAIDLLEEIAKISEKHDIWFHVDMHRAGGLLFSSKQKWRVQGIERSHSLSWSSRMLGSIYTSSFLLTRTPGSLFQAFGHSASYLFPGTSDLYNASYDRGDSTIQSVRRPDVMKTWFLWKAKGQSGLGAAIDLQYENLNFCVKELQRVKRDERFRVVLPSFDTPTVSFCYVPLGLRAWRPNSLIFYEQLNKFTLELKARLARHGVMYVSLSKCPTHPVIVFTLLLTNTALTKPDIKYLIDQIAFYGEGLDLNLNRDMTAIPPPPNTFPSFVSAPIAALHEKFFINLFQLFLKKGLFFQNKRKDPPTRFREPKELLQLVDLTLGDKALSEEELLKEFENTIDYTPHFAHPYFLLELMGGLDPYTLMADYVGSAINSPMITYEGSPATTIMEMEVIKSTCVITGYSTCDGVISDGGSLSNMMGIALARFHKYSDVKIHGNAFVGKELVFFISEDAHYSFNKGAFSLGLGLEAAISVKTDERGRMIPAELKTAIEGALSNGKVPFMVGATAGTPVYGAIDPLNEIANICEEFGLWFHVDGLAGPLLFSEKYKERLKGVERSDSFASNWHQILSGAHTMSILITPHAGIFQEAMSVNENVNGSIQIDNIYDRDTYDEGGDKQVQILRKANIIKIWFLWKAKGNKGLGQIVDYNFERAEFMLKEMKKTEGFEVLLPEFDVLNICFYYIPKRLRGLPKDEKYWKELDPIANKLYGILGKKGIVNIIAQNRGRNDTRFLKLPYLNSGVTDADSKYILQVIDHYGKDL